ncbi:MAG: methyltransferase [Gammaproteobacteria bacterium]|nr:methyltransferase [Gammaproteobacteria bacterium]MBU2058142.1 methyltransferase [Gammaproteobacteria bacterium]MBU2176049.1 methyltransferase [Gammaproteobacteria bacterium]MBU2247236.1 methyltransferase [Gammaproteobacteria bacterium]MBU2342668.1 methyltransferase [Gammaproteobacteria bacterium]
MLTIINRIKCNLNLVLLGAAFCSAAVVAETPSASDLTALAEHSFRSEDDKARNQYRHPVETLTFFGIKPGLSVLEIWPARGWYTDILAPYLKDQGKLTIANFRVDDGTMQDDRKIFWSRISEKLSQRILKHKEHFGSVEQTEFDPPAYMFLGLTRQYDMVLSFRNAHIWNEQGYLLDVFRAVFDVLKPGGVFGIVEHRASRVSEISSSAVEGYLDESYVIAVAEHAGFKLQAKSEVNANPKDSKDYPKGVYALPPTLAMGTVDREKYLAIGESDRMTLKFVKAGSE